ncbi:hypothetical protein [Burkholderia cenocepacia]|uniref:hypothetical protein n=1 Tax=Burkholderia cenocepacia TaxID=95486 RepID=UPI000AA6063F|nr:hypothetical protein [Burkholderia cenocepacia]
MKTASKVALKLVASAALCAAAGLGFYSLCTQLDLIRPVEAEAPVAGSLVAADQTPSMAAPVIPASTTANDDNSDGVEEVVNMPPSVEFLYVDVAARVSDSDGAVVALKVKGRAATCAGDATAPVKTRLTWSAVDAAADTDVGLIQHWCIPVKPGTDAAYRPFSGDWSNAAGSVDTDSASNYLRYTTPSGESAAVKTTALAACDDDKGCGFVASASVGEDDSRIQVNIPTGQSTSQPAWITSDDDSSQPVTVAPESPTASSEYRLTSPTIRSSGL